jgi:hypothetical protein
MKRVLSVVMLFVLVLGLATFAGAQTYKVAIMQVPAAEVYRTFIKALGEATNTTFDIQVVPPARTVYLIENKQVDLTFPLIGLKDVEKIKALKYDYSTTVVYKSAFVLITNKSKPVDIADLKKGNTKGYKIETDVSMVNQLEFTGIPSTSVEASLKKVDSGVSDGFIHSQVTVDAVLSTLKLSNVKRQLYDYFDADFTIQKGGRGGKVDKLLADGLNKLKANGKFDAILGETVKAAQYHD